MSPTLRPHHLLQLVLLAALALPAGCRARRDVCGDPVAVARTFIELMDGGEPARAFLLLSRAARERLESAARDATTRLGRKLSAADLLVPERSVLARPEWLTLRSTLGSEAWVDVRPPADAGPQARGPWSAQRLVREDGCWRIDLFHATGPTPDQAEGPETTTDGGSDAPP